MSISNLLVNNEYKLYADKFIVAHSDDTLLNLQYSGDGFNNLVADAVYGHKDGQNRSITFRSHNFTSTGGTGDIKTQLINTYHPLSDVYVPIVINSLGNQEVGTCILKKDGEVQIKRDLNDNFPAGNIGFYKFTINFTK